VLLPSGIGEEATLPGLMGSFGAVVSWHRETGLIRFSNKMMIYADDAVDCPIVL